MSLPGQSEFEALSDDAKYVHRKMYDNLKTIYLAAHQVATPKMFDERLRSERAVMPALKELEAAGFIHETGAAPNTQFQIVEDLHNSPFWPLE